MDGHYWRPGGHCGLKLDRRLYDVYLRVAHREGKRVETDGKMSAPAGSGTIATTHVGHRRASSL